VTPPAPPLPPLPPFPLPSKGARLFGESGGQRRLARRPWAGAILNGQCSNLNDAFLSILFVIAAVCVLGAATTAYGLAGAQQKKKSTRAPLAPLPAPPCPASLVPHTRPTVLAPSSRTQGASPGHLPGIRYVGESHHAPKTLA